MNDKFKIKRLKDIILSVLAVLCMGVIDCPKFGRITFKNYTECAIDLFVDTLYITTLKQGSIDQWDIEYWVYPTVTLLSSNAEKRFDIGPFYDSIRRDTTFLHVYKVEARINDSVVFQYFFPYLEKVPYVVECPVHLYFPSIDTVLVFGEKESK